MAAEKGNAALDRAMLIGHVLASQLQGRQRSIADAIVFDLAAKAGTYCFALIVKDSRAEEALLPASIYVKGVMRFRNMQCMVVDCCYSIWSEVKKEIHRERLPWGREESTDRSDIRTKQKWIGP